MGLREILHELAETAGRPHLHEEIDNLDKTPEKAPEEDAPAVDGKEETTNA